MRTSGQPATAAVVGGGLGGLASAVRLAARGWDATLFERSEILGGKCGRADRDGFHFDTGPSVLTLPHVVDDLFASAGRDRRDYLEIEPVEPGCRYFFADGTTFDAPGTLESFREALRREFPNELRGFDRFMRYGKRLWEVSAPVFLENPMNARSLARAPWPALLKGLTALSPISMHRAVRHFFKDPRLIQLFDRYATYNGSDPYRAPATFNVIAYVELAFGSWRCRGGMRALVDALERLARELGVEIRTGVPVRRLRFAERGRRVLGLETHDGATFDCARVVVNADAASALTGELFADHPKQPAWRRRYARKEASGSGFVLLGAVDRRYDVSLACHNVLFSGDYPREFREQFAREGRALSAPTVYISRPAAREPEMAPPGRDAWFVLTNAPSTDRFDGWDEATEAQIEAIVERARSAGIPFGRENLLWREVRTPRHFRDELGAWRGALYGPSSNGPLGALSRARNSGGVPGLAFAGGSAHPGGGIPLVLLSAKHAVGPPPR